MPENTLSSCSNGSRKVCQQEGTKDMVLYASVAFTLPTQSSLKFQVPAVS